MCAHVPHLNEIMCMARDSGPIEHEQAKDNFFYVLWVVASSVVGLIHEP